MKLWLTIRHLGVDDQFNEPTITLRTRTIHEDGAGNEHSSQKYFQKLVSSPGNIQLDQLILFDVCTQLVHFLRRQTPPGDM